MAVAAGRVLRPSDLGLIASLGFATVPVRPHLRVAEFSTGDELRSLDQTLDPGCVCDSNRYALMAALQRLGLEVPDLGAVRDDPAAMQTMMEAVAAGADVVLPSGCARAGDADHTRSPIALFDGLVG